MNGTFSEHIYVFWEVPPGFQTFFRWASPDFPKMDPQGNKHEPKSILLPVLGNPSSPGPERVIAAGN